jgi:F0F1-type ATP synthase epsilon subunit
MVTLKVSIIGTDKIAYEGEAISVFVPTQSGIIEVLPEHMQLVSALAPGEIILNFGKSDPSTSLRASQKFKVTGGVIEIRPESKIIILADIVKE